MISKRLQQIGDKAKRLATDAEILESWLSDPAMVQMVRGRYEQWYVAALPLVKGVLHEDEDERFMAAYSNVGTQNYMTSTTPSLYADAFAAMLARQKGLVAAIPEVVDARALHVRALVVGDVLGEELERARALLEQTLVREAGVIGGVALEGHLKLLHHQSALPYGQSHSIVKLGQCLRAEGVLALGDEKKLIAMADTRNKCAHKRDDEPTSQEVADFLDDVERFMRRTESA